MKKNIVFLCAASLLSAYTAQLHCTAGDLDTIFGISGVATTILSRTDYINSCTVQPDDTIVVAGVASGFYDRMGVARLTPNGSPDTTFNTVGAKFFLIGSQTIGQAVTLQSDNKILICGSALQSEGDIAVARLNTDGTFDTTFNSVGYVTTADGYFAIANAIVVQPDTNILAAGYAVPGRGDFCLVRYDAAGALDSGFGTGGVVNTAIGDGSVINAIALQNDGKIIAAGYVVTSGVVSFCLARYNTDGTLDTTGFGPDGTVTTTIGTESRIFSVAIQTNGYIVVTGYTIDDADGIYKFALARYDTTGALDTSFGTSGIVKTQIQYQAQAYGSILQADGKILAGGYCYDDQATQFALARYNTDGTLDSSFGTSGIARTTIGGHNSVSQINSLCLQSNGNIIAAGFSDTTYAIARYLAA